MTLDGHLKTGLIGAVLVMAQAGTGLSQESTMILACCVLLGNIAPDFLELGVIPHRTYTHYPVFWLLLLAGAVFGQDLELAPVQYHWYIAGFSAGCLWHIVCDWPYYGGVPLFSPTRKIALFRWEFDGFANRFFEHSMFLFGAIILFAEPITTLLSN